VTRAAALKDARLPNQREVSTAKLFATDAAVRAADETILLLGSRGYTSLSPAARMLRDAKGMQI
jgi:glutaryl-CoA dehydrogenase (non-decarboxylating)